MSREKPVYITAPEAALIIGLSTKTVGRLANEGVIFRRERGKARFLKSDVEAYARREAKALAQSQSAIRA
jgi:hypothetical protein